MASDDEMLVAPPPDDGHAGIPRWVRISLLVVGALVLVFILANVTGVAGDHGPGRHGGGDDSEVDDGGHRSPIDHDG
jgi:hypothetical protein